jgi:hypothetical protein
MITTTFTQIYPNQPWDPSVSDGNSVTVTWKGIRYHTFSRVTATGAVFGIEDSSDDLDELTNDLPGQVHEGHTFHILDALKDPHVAAFLFGDDTIPAKDASGGIADYVFNTPNDDEDYVYEYNTQNFVQSLYNGQEVITYNVDSDTFTMPGFLVHPLSNTSIFTAYEEEAERIDSAVTNRADEFTADELTALKASSVWLKGVRARYGSIEPWKIPHPEHGVTY